jgi:hypothetical protein
MLALSGQSLPTTTPQMETMNNSNEEVHCASRERCVVKELPRSTAHMCPGCGLSIHALCGHLNKDASIQYTTTCFFCYEKYGKALRDPSETHAISASEVEAPPTARTGNIKKKSAVEEESREASLLEGEGCIVAVPPSFPYSKHQRVVERAAKEVLKMANKTKAHELMKLVNIKGNTRAKSTINRHQKEHELFILYLYEHDNSLLEEHLLNAIQRETEMIEDTTLHLKRRRAVIKAFLEQGSSSTLMNPIKFHLLTATAFAKYLGSLTHHVTGCLLSQKMYKNKKTSLFRLFRIYKHKWTEEFDNELQDLIAGIKRIASKAKQEGLGSLEEGKRELSFDLYKKINLWFIEDGSSSAVFARAFLCLTWNLMCRVDSTEGVCIKHLVWSQDSVGIRFSHMKNDQDGSKNFKPRHCYANPED